MQEDVLGPLKELDADKKQEYTACDRCGRSLARNEVRAGAARGEEREALCASCYEDFVKGELLPPLEAEER